MTALYVDHLDPHTVVLYLSVPNEYVVSLQGFFDVYEGLGLVRTLNRVTPLIGVLSTPSLVADCISLLQALQASIPWSFYPGTEAGVFPPIERQALLSTLPN